MLLELYKTDVFAEVITSFTEDYSRKRRRINIHFFYNFLNDLEEKERICLHIISSQYILCLHCCLLRFSKTFFKTHVVVQESLMIWQIDLTLYMLSLVFFEFFSSNLLFTFSKNNKVSISLNFFDTRTTGCNHLNLKLNFILNGFRQNPFFFY